MGELGQIAIVGAFALALFGVGASILGARLRVPELAASGQNAAVGVTVLISTASLSLLAALATHDFSLRYVFDHSSRAMPLDLLLPSFYSGQQGSLLYWAWTLSIFSAIVLWQQRRPGPHRVFMPYVVAVLMGIQCFMTLLLGFVASPFERLPFTPPDGVGLNPLLYDDGMKIHPPMLLAGYMAWSVPFAFSIAALVTGRLGNEWVALARRYAMVAWLILGLGNVLGAWWAYRVLGWGGYWGWDPVENVAIMPWFVGTAFIHSIQIQERRGMLKGWNMALILITFYLSIFGTFVVRSGILQSVHSFALSAIGPYFLTYIGLAIVGSLSLFFWRLPRLRAENQLDSMLSREASFLVNNLLFIGIAFAIFWGTVYPLVAELATGAKVSVGAPYFQQVAGPLLGGMLLLMGIAPLMPWRRASRENLTRNFTYPVVAALVGAVVLAVLGVRNPVAVVGFGLCLFVLATIVQEFARGAAARHRATGEAHLLALGHLIRRNNRRYGGYIVHAAIVLLAIGIAGGAYGATKVRHLQPGESMTIRGYNLTYLGAVVRNGPNDREERARLAVSRGGDKLGVLMAGKNRYPAEGQVSNEVAIHSDWLRAQDLFVIGDQFNKDGSVVLKVLVNPLVELVWLAGLVFLFGSLIAMWPDEREQRRLARRTAPVPVTP
jgi:cytochrome c-type biogenesis protein CcmF